MTFFMLRFDAELFVLLLQQEEIFEEEGGEDENADVVGLLDFVAFEADVLEHRDEKGCAEMSRWNIPSRVNYAQLRLLSIKVLAIVLSATKASERYLDGGARSSCERKLLLTEVRQR